MRGNLKKTFLMLLLTSIMVFSTSCSKKKGSVAEQESFSEEEILSIYKPVFENDTDKVGEVLKANPKLVDAMFLRGGPHNGWPLIMVATANNNKELVELLISYGADVDARNNTDETSLLCAVSYGHIEMIELLLAHGADINAKSNNMDTPLDFAVDQGDDEIVKILRKHGAKK